LAIASWSETFATLSGGKMGSLGSIYQQYIVWAELQVFDSSMKLIEHFEEVYRKMFPTGDRMVSGGVFVCLLTEMPLLGLGSGKIQTCKI